MKFAVKKLEDIQRRIIPFFQKYQLQGKKKRDFDLFCQAAKIFGSKGHLTKRGLSKLRQIQSKMNLRRKLKWSSAKVRENRAPGGERSSSSDT